MVPWLFSHVSCPNERLDYVAEHGPYRVDGDEHSGAALIAIGSLVAVHPVAEPLRHTSTEANPFSPAWPWHPWPSMSGTEERS